MPKLIELLEYSRDGEWGQALPFDESLAMRVLRGTDFHSFRVGDFTSLPTRYIAQRHATQKEIRPNDIILETAGGSENRPTGRTVFARSSTLALLEEPLICASFARVLRIAPEKAHQEFVFWLLQYLYNTGHMEVFHTRHTGVARFQYTEFASRHELDIPPLPTQHKIASILSAYDDLIENNTRRIKILEETAQAIYREWFVLFRFPGHENVPMVDSELGQIPQGWEVKRLGELTEVITKGTTPSTLGKTFQDEGINFFKVESIDGHGLILENKLAYIDQSTHQTLRRSQLTGNDLLFSIAGAIGRVAKVPEKLLPANTNQALAIIRLSKQLIDEVHYFYWLLRSDSFLSFSLGRVVQTAQANVSLGVLKQAPVLCPRLQILSNFNEYVSPLEQTQETLEQKNQNLRKTRDLLLPRLISGRLDVEELDIAV